MDIWQVVILLGIVILSEFLIINYIMKSMKNLLSLTSDVVDILNDVLNIFVEKKKDDKKLLNENDVDTLKK